MEHTGQAVEKEIKTSYARLSGKFVQEISSFSTFQESPCHIQNEFSGSVLPTYDCDLLFIKEQADMN